MASRGQQQQGRSGQFDPMKPVRATLTMGPRDELRPKFERMVRATNLSHAELVRIALNNLKTDQEGRPEGWHSEEEPQIAS